MLYVTLPKGSPDAHALPSRYRSLAALRFSALGADAPGTLTGHTFLRGQVDYRLPAPRGPRIDQGLLHADDSDGFTKAWAETLATG